LSAAPEHPLDDAIRLTAKSDGYYLAHTHPDYANAVGPFGGITAAQLLQAAMVHPQRLGEPISQTVHFAAPIADGEFEICAEPVRTNRSTQHWLIQAWQQGHLVAMATAVFAVRRVTWHGTDAVFPEHLPQPQQLAAMQWQRRPPFTHRYDIRYAEGVIPAELSGEEQAHGRSSLWVRDEPPRVCDFPALASMCDIFFPRIMIRRQRWTPIGTVTLTSYFHVDQQTLQSEVGTDYLLGVARAQAYQGGYFDQSAELWSRTGRLLASTHQMVYFKE
jgi:acyl-CoA thioesterase